MEKQKIILECKPRDIIGKKVKTLRSQKQIPAILYGKEQKNVPIFFDEKKFTSVFDEAGTSTIVSLKVDGESSPRKVLIHEPQFHPVTGKPLHVDFYQVNMKEKIRTEIPIVLIGESEAVKDLEGNLITNKDAVEVECLPDDLISEITVDISVLKTFEDKIFIKDLSIPSEIEILDEPEELLISVTEPRSEEELEAELAPTTAEEEASKIEELSQEGDATEGEPASEENSGETEKQEEKN